MFTLTFAQSEQNLSKCVGLISDEQSGIQLAQEAEWTVGMRHLPRVERAGKTQVCGV